MNEAVPLPGAPAAPSTDIGGYLAERISEAEKQSEAASTSLRETAKWIISGIAVATAGVIAGTSLSALGALDYGPRYFEAVGAAAAAYVGLGILFATALAVIAPRHHSLQDIANGTGIPRRWRTKIEARLQPLLVPESKDLQAYCAYAANPRNADGAPLSSEDLVTFNLSRRWIGALAKSMEHDLQFRRLIFRTFALLPIIALAVLAFSTLANAPAEKRLAATEKTVEVDPGDVAVLRSALAGPSCVGQKLPVIVLSEAASGAQEVVTVPAAGCPPVRLRLDHGRLSKAPQ
jgi:hypothetical protein